VAAPGGGGAEHKCPHCSLRFAVREEMRAHVEYQHRSSKASEGYPCKVPGCGKVFGHRSSRCRHEKTAHPDGG
jgi:uncharacterized C2H2 Zn-finger protein